MTEQAVGRTALQQWASDRRVRIAIGIVAFVIATSFSARIAVPLGPVPMTLQPLLVVLAGALLGRWGGAAAMAAYLMVGAAGAPVFSQGGGGFPWLLGPTGGYLVAYPAAAFVVGALAQRSRSPVRLFAAFVAGLFVIYLGGVSQLMILTGQTLGVTLQVGVIPFLAGDLVKVLIALVVVRTVRTVRAEKGLER